MEEKSTSTERIRIGIYGSTNSGKSTLLNALTGQNIALVSEQKGTTTDPIRKAMEIPSIGPVLWIDTPGFDDPSALGKERENLAHSTVDEVDLALLLLSNGSDSDAQWISLFRQKGTPFLLLLAQRDRHPYREQEIEALHQKWGVAPYPVSALIEEDMRWLQSTIAERLKEKSEPRTITGELCPPGSLVMLVMPQDASAPKGRLILPQVQTIRELLDKQCTTLCVTPEAFVPSLGTLARMPDLIITDSQVFNFVYSNKPEGVPLTSFSILFAALKGDADLLVEGAHRMKMLSPQSHILIAEACTHAPQNEDIGRVKLPKMLRKKWGDELHIDIKSGKDFPEDLSTYDLIIHCGACMFNRTLVMNRIRQAQEQGVPITNYGMAIAYLNQILDKVVLPSSKK